MLQPEMRDDRDDHESPEAPRDNGISRRLVVKGAAWSIPVIAAATAVPMAAASAPPCSPVTFPIMPGDQTTAPEPQSVSLSTQGPDGSTYVVTISSAASTTTTVGQSGGLDGLPYTSFNLTTSGNGWAGNVAPDGSQDYTFGGFLPPTGGAIVLNQRAAVDPEPSGTAAIGSDLQTLTFVITKDGEVINPANFSMEIFDITSYVGVIPPGGDPYGGNGRGAYWDAVGFSLAPTSIAFTGSPGAATTGSGTGTLADPYHRSGSQEATPGSGYVSDTFTFATFPSGSTMQYSNYDGMVGWHFIAISSVTFDVPGCV